MFWILKIVVSAIMAVHTNAIGTKIQAVVPLPSDDADSDLSEEFVAEPADGPDKAEARLLIFAIDKFRSDFWAGIALVHGPEAEPLLTTLTNMKDMLEKYLIFPNLHFVRNSKVIARFSNM